MKGIMGSPPRTKRGVSLDPDVQFSEGHIRGSLAAVIIHADASWDAVERIIRAPAESRTIAVDLVPVERRGLDVIVSRLTFLAGNLQARRRSYAEGDARAGAANELIQRAAVNVWGDDDESLESLVAVWGVGDPPLVNRSRMPRFPNIGEALDVLARVLDRRCAVPGCENSARPPQTGSFTVHLEQFDRKSRLRPVTCEAHRVYHEKPARLRVRDLLVRWG